MLVNTLLEEEFTAWISKRLEDRERYIITKKNFSVNVIPQFAEAVAKSKSVSGKLSNK